ncbi:sugar transferase, partial [PVC group bacterium]|nr:sugar transferase [PVC group bacterium]
MLVGTEDIVESISKYITKHPKSGYKIKIKIMEDEIKQFGNLKTQSHSMGDMMRLYQIEDLIISMPLHDDIDINELILCADNEGVRARVATLLPNNVSRKHNLFKLNGIAIFDLRNEPLRYKRNKFVKRVFDIVVSLFAITFILSWLIPLIGIVLVYESRGAIIFRQKRIGIDGKEFICYKIRSMYCANKGNTQNSEKDFPNITHGPNDNRVT